MSEAMVVMGQVVAAYGVRGWIKIRTFSGEIDALGAYPAWWLRPRGGKPWREAKPRGARVHAGHLLAEIEGVDSREAAQALVGSEIAVARASLPAPAEGEMYIADLVGYAVVNRDGAALGRVSAVEEFGAHPLLRVAREDGKGEARLIPLVPPIVEGVDVAARRIEVDWEAEDQDSA